MDIHRQGQRRQTAGYKGDSGIQDGSYRKRLYEGKQESRRRYHNMELQTTQRIRGELWHSIHLMRN